MTYSTLGVERHERVAVVTSKIRMLPRDPRANLRVRAHLLTFRRGNQMARMSPRPVACQTEANDDQE